MGGDWPAEVRAGLEADLRRVTERLRLLSPAQLAAAAPPYPSRAAGARSVAAMLAEAAQGLAERSSGVEPTWRRLPELSDLAVGDQVAVTGHDLLAALSPPSHPAGRTDLVAHQATSAGDPARAGVGPTESVWAPGGRRTAEAVVAEAADHLAALRRLL